MSPTATFADLDVLSSQIDDLSTRLILEGVAALSPADFEHLSEVAAKGGYAEFARAAQGVAEEFAPASGASGPELTRIASSGLERLRRLLDGLPGDQRTGSAEARGPTSPAEPPAQTSQAASKTASSNMTLSADASLVREFVVESGEHLAAIERHVLVLEQGNSDADTLHAIFRGFHTIKGLAGFLEFAPIQSLAHEVESLLDLARTAKLAVTPPVIDVILESADVLRSQLASVLGALDGQQVGLPEVDPALLERVRRAALRGPAPEQAASAPAPAAAVAPNSISAASEAAPKRDSTADAGKGESSTVRIGTARLDQLMDMVGEMVIAQTLIGHSSALASIQDPALQRNLSQLARITADVQRITTGMRMVPIGMQFQKSARVVRELARRAGKQVVFETAGEDTELDKTIAEQLADPLLHMVRNSIDHGIESPAERAALGKDPTARIRVSAYHRSGQIVISISDDGRGLNREKIVAKAIANNLIAASSQMEGDAAFQLIFEPGFSTAEKITDISGRGVGMDVVRRHVQKLRGQIEVQSTPGQGTTFLIKLPLTLAIIDGLIVLVGSHRYIVPIFSVREMFRPRAEMLSTVQGRGEMVLVRGSVLPIVRLHRCFSVEPRSLDPTQGTLIVAESEGQRFCLLVDELVGKQEVVIKSLGDRFQSVAGLAGCAILGDGSVGLILDIDRIHQGRA